MAQRIDLGRALVALGALLLVVALFLDWYAAGGTAWEVFEALDLLLLGLAAGAVYAALRADARTDVILRVAPFAALAVVVVQILNPPPVLQLATDALRAEGAGDPDTGAWLALAGSALMAAGAVLVVARISVTIDLAGRDAPAGASASGPAAGDREPSEMPTSVTPAAAAAPAPATGSRRPATLLGGDRPEPSEPLKGGPPADPRVHPAEPAKAGPDRQPEGDGVREVAAIDHREGRAAPTEADEPEPTQPLRVQPDERP